VTPGTRIRYETFCFGVRGLDPRFFGACVGFPAHGAESHRNELECRRPLDRGLSDSTLKLPDTFGPFFVNFGDTNYGLDLDSDRAITCRSIGSLVTMWFA
jgi:hypothetical protein